MSSKLEKSFIPKTVYYSNFWYSRFYRPSQNDLSGDIVDYEVEQHKIRIRVLSLFFETIYIPRTHLITMKHVLQKEIDEILFDDRDIGFLLERGKLRISSFPGVDAKQDNERIISRSEKAKSVIYPDDTSFLKKIPITEIYEVDSLSEAASNVISFPQYGELIANFNKDISSKFLEIVDRANLTEIPFFHEDFLGLLREEFEDEIFFKIWRETNSIYLTTGGIGQENLIAFFNEELESTNFRFSPFNLDRYLYSPSSLRTFLQHFLSGEEYTELIFGEIEQVFGFMYSNADYQVLGSRFRSDYHRLVARMSRQIRPMDIQHILDQTVINELYDLALNDGFRRGSTLLSSLIDDAEKISRAADVDGSGLIGGSARAVMRHGQGLFQRFNLARRYSGIVHFTNVLKGNLKQKG